MGFEINERIKKYRKEKNMDQKAMAEALDMNYSTYSQMEREGKKIPAITVIKIAEILGVDSDLLFYGYKRLDMSPIEPEPLIFEDPDQVPEFVAKVNYVTDDMKISHEEKIIIKQFRDFSEDKKNQVRELFKKLR